MTRLKKIDDLRLFTVFEALKSGVDIDTVFDITRIDRWFLAKLLHLAEFEKQISGHAISRDAYNEAKRLGYTDKALIELTGQKPAFSAEASYKMVDTCAAEFDAETPYFYASYDSACDSRRFPRSGKTRDFSIRFRPHPHRPGDRV